MLCEKSALRFFIEYDSHCSEGGRVDLFPFFVFESSRYLSASNRGGLFARIGRARRSSKWQCWYLPIVLLQLCLQRSSPLASVSPATSKMDELVVHVIDEDLVDQIVELWPFVH